MSDLFMCPNCKETYFIYDSDDTCKKCGERLVAMCEWCNNSESECSCSKDNIKSRELTS